VNYIDRATLAVANQLVRDDLGLSIPQMGWLLSAFLWAYAFAQLPAGALVDRLGPRRLLACGLALWSGAQVLAGLVRGFGQFYAARLLLGVGEAPQFPTGARVARDWFSARDRGLATGIFNCASSLGTAVSLPLLTWLMRSPRPNTPIGARATRPASTRASRFANGGCCSASAPPGE
jgi:MFS family permease